jgi:DNA-binding ferritin-like protein
MAEKNKELLGKAVATLADCCAAVAGDMHTAHLLFKGNEFDNFHKKVLKKYYEELDDDYDELAEWAVCYGYQVKNKNESAKRVEYQSWDPEHVARSLTVEKTGEVLTELLDQFKELYNALNKITDCIIAIGLANYLQDKIQYWAKEIYFFNARRAE